MTFLCHSKLFFVFAFIKNANNSNMWELSLYLLFWYSFKLSNNMLLKQEAVLGFSLLNSFALFDWCLHKVFLKFKAILLTTFQKNIVLEKGIRSKFDQRKRHVKIILINDLQALTNLCVQPWTHFYTQKQIHTQMFLFLLDNKEHFAFCYLLCRYEEKVSLLSKHGHLNPPPFFPYVRLRVSVFPTINSFCYRGNIHRPLDTLIRGKEFR